MKNPRVQVKLSREELSKLALYLRHAFPFKYFKRPYYVYYNKEVYVVIGKDKPIIDPFPYLLYSKQRPNQVIYAGKEDFKPLTETEVLLYLL